MLINTYLKNKKKLKFVCKYIKTKYLQKYQKNYRKKIYLYIKKKEDK